MYFPSNILKLYLTYGYMFMRQNSGKVVTSIHFLSYTATKHTKRKLKTRILNIIKDKTRMNLEHENYIRKVNYTLFQPCLLRSFKYQFTWIYPKLKCIFCIKVKIQNEKLRAFVCFYFFTLTHVYFFLVW